MNEQARISDRLDDLPEETKRFLSQLRDDDIETLKDGLRLVTAIRTVGTFSKWLIVSIVGAFIGFVMLWESVAKFFKLIGPVTK